MHSTGTLWCTSWAAVIQCKYGAMNAMALACVQKRNTTKGQRSKENRQSADRMFGGTGPEGDTEWEKAISLINFGFARPNGSDLSRFKNVLFAAKSRNVPTAGAADAKA